MKKSYYTHGLPLMEVVVHGVESAEEALNLIKADSNHDYLYEVQGTEKFVENLNELTVNNLVELAPFDHTMGLSTGTIDFEDLDNDIIERLFREEAISSAVGIKTPTVYWYIPWIYELSENYCVWFYALNQADADKKALIYWKLNYSRKFFNGDIEEFNIEEYNTLGGKVFPWNINSGIQFPMGC
jgi:hypothetical protein